MSKWTNNVGQICTWQKWEDVGCGELQMTKDWKVIEILKEFEGLYKNCMYLEKHSEHLEKLLNKDYIKIEEFNKQMRNDISNTGDFVPKKPGNYKFISHILNLPPQEFKQKAPPPFGKRPALVEIRQNGSLKPYVLFMQDVEFKLVKKDDKLQSIFINLENEIDKINFFLTNGNITEEERDAKLEKLKIDGTDNYWLLYRGYLNKK